MSFLSTSPLTLGLDYTEPRRARRKALLQYHFLCNCPRCKDDLDVYQVGQRSPVLELNRSSLQPDIATFQHPGVDRSKVSKAEIEDMFDACANASGDGMDRIHRQWTICKPLINAGMWAVQPLESVLLEVFKELAARHDESALPIISLICTKCEPYRYTAPFMPWRIKCMWLLAQAVDGFDPAHCKSDEIRAIMKNTQWVFVWEAVVRLIVHWGSIGGMEAWDVVTQARDEIRRVDQTPGRRHAVLIQTWINEPQDPEAKRFVDEKVLKPLSQLAELAVDMAGKVREW